MKDHEKAKQCWFRISKNSASGVMTLMRFLYTQEMRTAKNE